MSLSSITTSAPAITDSDSFREKFGDAYNLLYILLNNAYENFLLIDLDLRIQLYSQSSANEVKELFNIDLTQGMHVLDLAMPERIEALKVLYADVFAGNKHETEITVPTRTGATRYIHLYFAPAKTEKGNIVGAIVSTRDVTTKKLTERSLRETQQRWRFALEGSNQGLWDWNLQTGECYYSDSYKTLYGFEKHELQNKIEEWENRLHPEDKIIVDEALEKHVAQLSQHYECVYRLQDKYGHYRWVLAKGMIILRDEDGQPLRMVGTHTDITTQKNTEENYKLLFFSNPIPMWTFDWESLHFLDVNDAAIANYGYSREEFLNMKLPDIRPWEDVTMFQELMEAQSHNSNVSYRYLRHQRKNGENFYVNITRHLFEQEGKKVGLVIAENITKHVEAEKKLKQSELQYKTLFNTNPQPCWIYDVSTLSFLEVNDAAIRHYGYTKDEFAKLSLLDLHPLEQRPALLKRIEKEKNENELSVSGWQHLKKDGSVFFVDIKSNAFIYNNTPARLIVINDISKKLLAEQNLRTSNERFQLAAEASSEILWEWNIATGQTYMSEAYTKLLGWPVNTDREFGDWEKVIHPDDRADTTASYLQALNDPACQRWHKEYRYLKADGNYATIVDKAVIIRDSDGKPQRVVGAMQDITEQKKTEEELRNSNERYHYAALATADIIWDWDIRKKHILWSDNFERILGWKLPNNKLLPDDSCVARFHPDDSARVWKSLLDVVTDPAKTKWHEEFKYARADGSYAYVIDRGFVIRNDQGEAIRMIGAMQDISEEHYLTELSELKRNVYKMNASADVEFEEVLSTLVTGLERTHPGMHCAILMLKPDQSVQNIIAPGLPSTFEKGVREYELCHKDSAFGAALATRQTVIITDISKAKFDDKYNRFAKAFNFKSFWAFPILGRNGSLLGSLTIFYTVAKSPEKIQSATIDRICDLLRILLENHSSTLQIKRANERFDIVMKATHDLIWDWDLETGVFYRDKEGMKKVYGILDETQISNANLWLQRIHPDDCILVEKVIDKILHATNQDTFDVEYRFMTDEGNYTYVYDRAILIRNSEGKPIRMIGAAQNITERKQLELQLLTRELEKQKLISQATIETQEQERSEIGKELHDNVNQVLTTTKLYLDLSLSNPELKDELIGKSSKNIIYVINEIRQLSRSLMNPSLGDLGLIESINDLIENINLTRKLKVTLRAENSLEETLTENQKLMIFRIVQEVLNNAIKHAQASKVKIGIAEAHGEVKLRIEDDGVGFDPMNIKKGAGLNHIQNRVYLANGTVLIESSPGKGCNFIINFPTHI